MRSQRNIVILGGGHSEEREVSLVSAHKVAESLSSGAWRPTLLDPADFPTPQALLDAIVAHHPDIVFFGLHGGAGEDGRLQAMLELAGIPFTGSRYAASALAMNKLVSQQLAAQLGIAVPATFSLRHSDARAEAITGVGFPMVVKPNHGGSSVGITLVQQPAQLPEAIELARRYDRHVLLQQFIAGRELTVTILDQAALPVVEIIPRDGWYDYKHKYTKGETEYHAPADISPDIARQLQQQALAIYQAMGCEGYARVDFRGDGDDYCFLEVNTLPGMTPLSLTPMAAREAGYSFLELLETIIEVALRGDWTTPFANNKETIRSA